MCDAPMGMSIPACRDDWKKFCMSDPVNGRGGQCAHFAKQELDAGRSTMDTVVTAFCRDNPDHVDCSCLQPPECVKRAQKEMERRHGSVGCWYAGCHRPDALKTLSLHRRECAHNECIFEPDDFKGGKSLPNCGNEKFGEQLWTPVRIENIIEQTAWLTRPRRLLS